MDVLLASTVMVVAAASLLVAFTLRTGCARIKLALTTCVNGSSIMRNIY